jgi:hypothetical protein
MLSLESRSGTRLSLRKKSTTRRSMVMRPPKLKLKMQERPQLMPTKQKTTSEHYPVLPPSIYPWFI